MYNSKILETLIIEIQEKIKRKTPIIVGVTGAMAIGKSTFSIYLKKKFTQYHISIIHTDGFLFPNNILQEKNIINKKGFPETFNQKEFQYLLSQLTDIEGTYTIPYYSHRYKDIHPTKQQIIEKSDIYIIEGINLFFNLNIYKSTFDFLVFLKMSKEDIKKQFILRFNKSLQQAKLESNPYFKNILDYSAKEIQEYQDYLWQEIHLPFNKQYIEPFEKLATHKMTVKHRV